VEHKHSHLSLLFYLVFIHTRSVRIITHTQFGMSLLFSELPVIRILKKNTRS